MKNKLHQRLKSARHARLQARYRTLRHIQQIACEKGFALLSLHNDLLGLRCGDSELCYPRHIGDEFLLIWRNCNLRLVETLYGCEFVDLPDGTCDLKRGAVSYKVATAQDWAELESAGELLTVRGIQARFGRVYGNWLRRRPVLRQLAQLADASWDDYTERLFWARSLGSDSPTMDCLGTGYWVELSQEGYAVRLVADINQVQVVLPSMEAVEDYIIAQLQATEHGRSVLAQVLQAVVGEVDDDGDVAVLDCEKIAHSA